MGWSSFFGARSFQHTLNPRGFYELAVSQVAGNLAAPLSSRLWLDVIGPDHAALCGDTLSLFAFSYPVVGLACHGSLSISASCMELARRAALCYARSLQP